MHEAFDSPTVLLVVGSSVGGFRLVWAPHGIRCCCVIATCVNVSHSVFFLPKYRLDHPETYFFSLATE